MKTTFTLLFAAILLSSCSSDDKPNNCECNGRFTNFQTGETIITPTDCERTPPEDGFLFVECTDGQPNY